MNFIPVAQGLFLPCIVFWIVSGVTTFHIHYSQPWLCWAIVGAAFLLVLFFAHKAWAAMKAKQNPNAKGEPTWYTFLFLTTSIALLVGVFLGNMIFWNFMQRYYDYLNLNDYVGVDVSRMRGQQVMDVGRMEFVQNTTVDLRWAMGFQNLQTYCVAPLTMVNQTSLVKEQLTSYDFWAVGIGCCSGSGTTTKFECGEFDNPKARGGLRVLEDGDRAFYRLAVQQAEALYHINANHPLFLYWTEDPVGEQESWKQDGYKYFYMGMLVHFVWQFLVLGLAILGFYKMGHY